MKPYVVTVENPNPSPTKLGVWASKYAVYAGSKAQAEGAVKYYTKAREATGEWVGPNLDFEKYSTYFAEAKESRRPVFIEEV